MADIFPLAAGVQQRRQAAGNRSSSMSRPGAVCRARGPISKTLQAQPDNANLVVFRVDFDEQKDVVRSFQP
jgi:hypothetical protein